MISEEIKEIKFSRPRPGDEIISVHEVCLGNKRDLFIQNDDNFASVSNKNSCLRPNYRSDGFFCEGLDSQASFTWTEEDGNIAAFVSEPGFGTGQATFGNLDATIQAEIKKEKFFPSVTSAEPWYLDTNAVSTSSNYHESPSFGKFKAKQAYKVDKSDPRTRMHYLKFVKRVGRVIKLWECSICGREFQHQYTLVRHLPTHTDERNFHCSTCGNSFRQLSTLTQHFAIHSSERPYGCEICSKTFNRVSTLISHRKTHSENKPYKCHICPKGFHQKGNLRNHLFTHTDERPYRCNICQQGFNQQSNLVCHKNKAHPEDVEKTPSSVTTQKLPNIRPSMMCQDTSKTTLNSSLCMWPENQYPSLVLEPNTAFHVNVGLSRKATPFALLKPNDSAPLLVKIVDVKIGGKQMFVPATADDLIIGEKILVNNDSSSLMQESIPNSVQVQTPVESGPRWRLVQESTEDCHVLSDTSECGEVPSTVPANTFLHLRSLNTLLPSHTQLEDVTKLCPDSSYLLSGAFSPPLDLMPPLDIFGAMDCIPMGPQVTAVDNIELPQDDDADIFIGQFEKIIPISESD